MMVVRSSAHLLSQGLLCNRCEVNLCVGGVTGLNPTVVDLEVIPTAWYRY